MSALMAMSARSDMNSGAWLVLAVLSNHFNNQTGTCYPSMATIARQAKLGVKVTRRHVHKLIELGYITVDENAKGGARGSTPLYRALFEPVDNPRTPPSQGSPSGGECGTKPSPPEALTPPSRASDPSPARAAASPLEGSQTLNNHIRNLDMNQRFSAQVDPLNDPNKTRTYEDWVKQGRRLGLDHDPGQLSGWAYIAEVKKLLTIERSSQGESTRLQQTSEL